MKEKLTEHNKTATTRVEKPPLTDILLGIALLSTLPLFFVAPGLVRIVDLFGREWLFPRKRVHEALKRLERKGRVRIKASGRYEWKFELTSAGRDILKKKEVESLKLGKPKRWDGKWRLVMFDIPEKLREIRGEFRWKLSDLGFRCINLSVWACPYECMNEINAIAEYYKVGSYVKYIEANHVDGLERPS